MTRREEPGTTHPDEAATRVLSLLARGTPRVVTLDEIGEAFGLDWAKPEQIEWLFDQLESRGFTIGEPEPVALAALLRSVLVAARGLRAAGRAASPSDIASDTGLDVREVRVALLYAEVLGRGAS